MKNQKQKPSEINSAGNSPVIILLFATFIVGIISGTMTAIYIPHSENSYVARLASFFVESFISEEYTYINTLIITLIDNLKYFLFIIIASFLPIGFLLIPLIMASKGFFLSFAVSALIYSLGVDGLFLGLIAVGFSSIFLLPSLFIFASLFIETSVNPRPFSQVLASRDSINSLRLVVILQILSILVDTLIVPNLIKIVV